MQNKRESNIELLRIIAMLLIVLAHCITHGVGEYSRILNFNLNFNVFSSFALGIWGGLGVNIFIVITCWFMAEKKNIKIKKVVKMLMQTWSTCFIIMLILKILKVNITGKDIIKQIITPIYTQYWFITTYLLFYMIIPILKMFVDNISIEQHKKYTIILTAIIVIFKQILISGNEIIGTLGEFIYIFILVTYLKKIKDNFLEKYSIKIAILTFSFIIFSLICLNVLNQYFGFSIIKNIEYMLIGRNMLTIILAVALFYIFKNHVKIGNSNIINTISKSTLGVYIIHENMLLRGSWANSTQSILWNNIFHIKKWYETNYFVLYYLGICILTFIVCVLLEKIREKIIDENIFKRIKIIDRLCMKFDKWYNFDMNKKENYK